MPQRKGAWSWALYDAGNSAFILCVITTLYAPFFSNVWAGERPDAYVWLGRITALTSVVVALVALFAGSAANRGRRRKRFLAIFAIVGSLATISLALIPDGSWELAALARLIASVGFFGSLVFYDALLPEVSSESDEHRVSALGFSVGYLGSVLLLLAQLALIFNPQWLGLADGEVATRLAFVSVGVWWIVFTLPLLLKVPESELPATTRGGFLPELRSTLVDLWGRPLLLGFLVAYWLYIDGVNTFAQMASAFADALDVPFGELVAAIIVVQIVGVPCALLFGFLGQRFGPRPFIALGILVYLGVTFFAYRFSVEPVVIAGIAIPRMVVLGIGIGFVQGGLQALSRSYYNRLIPRERAASYYGLYNVLGKGGAILGPLLMGELAGLTGDPRDGAFAVGILFLLGLAVFLFLPRLATERPRTGSK